jgi:catechol 2,3-dioxygenase-like lactoylglutathione lyase family enzyme
MSEAGLAYAKTRTSEASRAGTTRRDWHGEASMRLQDFYPIIVTEQLMRCRDFYRTWFGMAVVFEASWFVLLSDEEGGKASLAFMHPSHPSTPPGPEPFNGQGLCLEFQVENAGAAYERFVREGAEVRLALRDEPFRQRRFGLFDPAGVWIDVVEQIEPTVGWWDRYLGDG